VKRTFGDAEGTKCPSTSFSGFKKFFSLFFFLFEGVLSCGEYDTFVTRPRKRNFSQKKLRGIIQESLEAQNICKKRSGTQLKTRKTIQDGRDFLLLLLHNVRTVHNSVKEAKGDHHPLRSKCRFLLLITTTTTKNDDNSSLEIRLVHDISTTRERETEPGEMGTSSQSGLSLFSLC
jgi:hypothetical protein